MSNAKSILVIEDDIVLRDLLGDWLVAAGYRVALAPEGCAGIEAARASRPALVVTDMHMPGSGGGTVIAEVARLYPGLPVIAISGHFRSGHGLTPEQALELGAARAIAKPFRRGDILGAVKELAGPPSN
jgi:CheY-like chemotaxis protein